MRFDYHRPRTVEEAIRLKRTVPGSRLVAGGTDLLVKIKSGLERPEALISLRSVSKLAGIEAGETTRIGALTTITDVMEHGAVRERYPILVQAMERLAFRQIRNAATLGGNLCNASPCADTAPPLLVLEARACLLAASGHRDVPVEDLFVGPGETCLAPDEVLAAILVDAPSPTARGVFLKKRRVHVDIGLASVAVLLDIEGETCRRARIAAGAVAPVPLRLTGVESLLEGQRITPDVLDRAQELAADCVSPISDIRASADYRRHIVGVFVRRGLASLLRRRAA